MLLLKNGTERKGVEKKERKKKGGGNRKASCLSSSLYDVSCNLHVARKYMYVILQKHINNYIASILDYCVPRFDFNIRIFRNNKERKGKKNKKTNRIMQTKRKKKNKKQKEKTNLRFS